MNYPSKLDRCIDVKRQQFKWSH